MRVASSDWCASRIVVSVTSSPLCARTAAAQPSGPLSSSTPFQPSSGLPVRCGKTGVTGLFLLLGAPMAPGWLGPLTTISLR